MTQEGSPQQTLYQLLVEIYGIPLYFGIEKDYRYIDSLPYPLQAKIDILDLILECRRDGDFKTTIENAKRSYWQDQDKKVSETPNEFRLIYPLAEEDVGLLQREKANLLPEVFDFIIEKLNLYRRQYRNYWLTLADLYIIATLEEIRTDEQRNRLTEEVASVRAQGLDTPVKGILRSLQLADQQDDKEPAENYFESYRRN